MKKQDWDLKQQKLMLNEFGNITANVLQLGGRFNAAKPLLYAGTVD